jgi:hypothetical protein
MGKCSGAVSGREGRELLGAERGAQRVWLGTGEHACICASAVARTVLRCCGVRGVPCGLRARASARLQGPTHTLLRALHTMAQPHQICTRAPVPHPCTLLPQPCRPRAYLPAACGATPDGSSAPGSAPPAKTSPPCAPAARPWASAARRSCDGGTGARAASRTCSRRGAAAPSGSCGGGSMPGGGLGAAVQREMRSKQSRRVQR